jgi:hypothetical protein
MPKADESREYPLDSLQQAPTLSSKSGVDRTASLFGVYTFVLDRAKVKATGKERFHLPDVMSDA